MADMRVLLTGLTDYQNSLGYHLNQVRDEFQQLESRWNALNVVYEGTAADEFRSFWLVTISNFNNYIDQTQQISSILQDRIDALNEADRAVGL